MNSVIRKFESNPNVPTGKEYQSFGGGGGSVEARLAKVEADVENIKVNLTRVWDDLRDFRNEFREDLRGMNRVLWGSAVLIIIGLLSVIAKVYNWV